MDVVDGLTLLALGLLQFGQVFLFVVWGVFAWHYPVEKITLRVLHPLIFVGLLIQGLLTLRQFVVP